MMDAIWTGHETYKAVIIATFGKMKSVLKPKGLTGKFIGILRSCKPGPQKTNIVVVSLIPEIYTCNMYIYIYKSKKHTIVRMSYGNHPPQSHKG